MNSLSVSFFYILFLLFSEQLTPALFLSYDTKFKNNSRKIVALSDKITAHICPYFCGYMAVIIVDLGRL